MYGRNLEKGTEVYMFRPVLCPTGIFRFVMSTYQIGCIDKISYMTHPECYMYIRENDGLWATPGIRKLWREKPFLHPHYTLFQAIYTTLEK